MVRGNFEVVRFVLAQLFDRIAGGSSFHDEAGVVELCLAPQRNASLPRKRHQESLLRALQPRFRVPLQCDSEISVNQKLTLPLYRMQG